MIAVPELAIARAQLPFADLTYKMEIVGVGRALMRLHETVALTHVAGSSSTANLTLFTTVRCFSALTC